MWKKIKWFWNGLKDLCFIGQLLLSAGGSIAMTTIISMYRELTLGLAIVVWVISFLIIIFILHLLQKYLMGLHLKKLNKKSETENILRPVHDEIVKLRDEYKPKSTSRIEYTTENLLKYINPNIQFRYKALLAILDTLEIEYPYENDNQVKFVYLSELSVWTEVDNIEKAREVGRKWREMHPDYED